MKALLTKIQIYSFLFVIVVLALFSLYGALVLPTPINFLMLLVAVLLLGWIVPQFIKDFVLE